MNVARENCDCQEPTGDRTRTQTGDRRFDSDATSWLVGEAITRLHADKIEGRGDYTRATELLARVDAVSAIDRIFHAAPREEVSLRWALLYVLADTGDVRAADLFARVAVDPIKVERDPRACETAYDGEVLVRTMAIEGLSRLAARDQTIVAILHKVIEAQPDRALRIEAVKAIVAVAPGDVELLRKTLPEDLHFALTLKRVGAQSLAVEYEATRVDQVRAMPNLDGKSVRPSAQPRCCC